MDANEYFLECVIRDRLSEARREAARIALSQLAAPPRRPWRRALGVALVRLGQRLLHEPSRRDAAVPMVR